MNSDEKILVIDDDVIFLKIILNRLSGKYNITTASSGMEGLELVIKEGPFALVAADYIMPEIDGTELLEKIRVISPDTVRMMITGIQDLQSLIDIINNTSIFRIISKPCSPEILGRVFEKGIEQYNLVLSEKRKREEAEAAYKQLIEYAKAINESVVTLKNKNRELNNAYYDTINRLVVASEYKDEDTHEHIVRMSRYCALLAEKAGFPSDEVENILFASPMHDIGKIGIPDAILMKPGKLDLSEFNEIKKHTLIGSKILEGSRADILILAASIAISHHEKWDGSGYPFGISGEKIPITGRIVAIADVFDALTSKRPYKEALPVEVAFDIIQKGKGNHFDPDLTDIFLNSFDDFLQIKENVASESSEEQ